MALLSVNSFSLMVLPKQFLQMTQSSVKKNDNYQHKNVQKSTFCFSFQVTYPDGIAQCK